MDHDVECAWQLSDLDGDVPRHNLHRIDHDVDCMQVPALYLSRQSSPSSSSLLSFFLSFVSVMSTLIFLRIREMDRIVECAWQLSDFDGGGPRRSYPQNRRQY